MSMLEIREVSIITRAYNVENYIKECAESVLNQTFDDFEWLVLENGSTDGTGKILEKYSGKDNRIRLFKNEENYNTIVPSQDGYYTYLDLLKESRGKYIVDLDSDDYLDIDFLKILHGSTGGKMVDIVAGGSTQFVNDNPEDIEIIVVPEAFDEENIAEMGNDIRDFFDAFRPVWGKMVSRELYMNNLDYIFDRPSYISMGGDTYTCLRLLQLAKSCICIDKPLYFYRVRRNSVSTTNYYRERFLSYDAIFYEGLRLLKMWQKNSQNNFVCLCTAHKGGLAIELKMISNTEGISLQERLDYIEHLLQDEVYLEYIPVFSKKYRRSWGDIIEGTLGKIYNDYLEEVQDKNLHLFYKYNFSRRFISKKFISDKSCNKYDIMLYMAAAASASNTVAYDDELLYLCIKYITGEEAASLEEARNIIQQFTDTEEKQREKKEKMEYLIGVGAYEEVEELLETFNDKMVLDCDILFSRACCSIAKGDIKNALVLLAAANELYPEMEVIQENLDNILRFIK